MLGSSRAAPCAQRQTGPIGCGRWASRWMMVQDGVLARTRQARPGNAMRMVPRAWFLEPIAAHWRQKRGLRRSLQPLGRRRRECAVVERLGSGRGRRHAFVDLA